MNKSELTKYFFEPKNLLKNTTSYIVYYQIGLGNLVYGTLHDIEETQNKLIELNLTLNPNDVILTTFLIASSLQNKENFTKELDKQIQLHALQLSLEHFVQNDHELFNKQSYKNQMTREIQEGSFFNSQLKIQFLKEYAILYKDYEKVINEKFCLKVKDILTKNFSSYF